MIMASRKEKMKTPLAIIILALLVFTAYFNALKNGFTYDDVPQIVLNSEIRKLENIPRMLSTGVWEILEFYDVSSKVYFRPVMMATLALEYHFFGLDPRPYHFVNICLHLLFVLSFFFAARFFLGSLSRKGRLPIGAQQVWWSSFLAAAFFSVHPINAQSVDWISAFTEILYSLLLLWAVILSLGRSWKHTLASLILAFISMLTKETAVVYLPMILVGKILFDAEYSISGRQRYFRLVKREYVFLLPLLAYAALRFKFLGNHDIEPDIKHMTLLVLEYFVFMPSLILRGLWHMVFPFFLTVYYRFGYWADYLATVVFGLIIIGGGLILSFGRKISAANKLILFVCGWLYLIPSLPTFSPLLYHLYLSDRYLYLPATGFCLLLAYCAVRLWAAFGSRKSRLAIVMFGGSLVVLWIGLTVRQNNLWYDDRVLFNSAAATNPQSGLAEIWRLSMLCSDPAADCVGESARGQSVILDDVSVPEKYKKVIPNSFYFQHDLAKRDFDAAHDDLRKVMAADAGKRKAAGSFFSLSVAEYRQGDREAARADLAEAMQLFPESRTLNLFLGMLACEENDLDAAQKYFDLAVQYGYLETTIRPVRLLCPGRSVFEYQEHLDYLIADPFRRT